MMTGDRDTDEFPDTVPTSTRFSQTEIGALNRAAKTLRRTKSFLIRAATVAWLEDEQFLSVEEMEP